MNTMTGGSAGAVAEGVAGPVTEVPYRTLMRPTKATQHRATPTPASGTRAHQPLAPLLAHRNSGALAAGASSPKGVVGPALTGLLRKTERRECRNERTLQRMGPAGRGRGGPAGRGRLGGPHAPLRRRLAAKAALTSGFDRVQKHQMP